MVGKHGGTTDHRSEPPRLGPGREWIVIVLGIACVGFGIYVLWAQHTGIVADVQVLECHDVGRHGVCSGQWRDGTVMSPVKIVAMSLPHPGDTVAMRIHGSKAYSRSASLPLLPGGFGAVALFAGGYSRHRRRQSD